MINTLLVFEILVFQIKKRERIKSIKDTCEWIQIIKLRSTISSPEKNHLITVFSNDLKCTLFKNHYNDIFGFSGKQNKIPLMQKTIKKMKNMDTRTSDKHNDKRKTKKKDT